MLGTKRAFRLILSCLVTLAGALTSWSASALPSMARQTASPCSQCHTAIPELTPYGRQFKLGAFSATSSNWAQKEALSRIPLSAAVQLSRTKTRDANAAMGDGEENLLENDGRAIVQTVAGYYAGRIANNMGALVQGNYEGAERRWAIEMADIRYAQDTLVSTRELTYGVTLNNTPTVTDLYNSTPSWRFPHTESLSPVMPARTLVNISLASQVAGVSTYAMGDSSIYAELGLYGAAKKGVLRIFSAGVPKETLLSGGVPYWRLAYQNELDNLSYSGGPTACRRGCASTTTTAAPEEIVLPTMASTGTSSGSTADTRSRCAQTGLANANRAAQVGPLVEAAATNSSCGP